MGKLKVDKTVTKEHPMLAKKLKKEYRKDLTQAEKLIIEQDVVKNGLTQREASLKFNVGKGTIGRIITAYNNGSLSNSTIS